MVYCRRFAHQLCRGGGSLEARLRPQPGLYIDCVGTNVPGGHVLSNLVEDTALGAERVSLGVLQK